MPAIYHLPGLFEFYPLYKEFLPLYQKNRSWFYDWCRIGSIYGSPQDALWSGGRTGCGDSATVKEVLSLIKTHNVSARLTFSNSLITPDHLQDKFCNNLCCLFYSKNNGIIVHSDLLTRYLKENYPDYKLVSSTTKVLPDISLLQAELNRPEFSYVVPDFRLNVQIGALASLSLEHRRKLEILCNECCAFDCKCRSECYQNVSAKVMGLPVKDHVCPNARDGRTYSFSSAMENPGFVGLEKIQHEFLPAGINNFKIEGRSLGSALVLEMLIYYMVKPEFQIHVREKIYLDNSLDLF